LLQVVAVQVTLHQAAVALAVIEQQADLPLVLVLQLL
jgi:hypothetical protein